LDWFADQSERYSKNFTLSDWFGNPSLYEIVIGGAGIFYHESAPFQALNSSGKPSREVLWLRFQRHALGFENSQVRATR
jgi:hypothetical protein